MDRAGFSTASIAFAEGLFLLNNFLGKLISSNYFK